jgi:hypothetical protein
MNYGYPRTASGPGDSASRERCFSRYGYPRTASGPAIALAGGDAPRQVALAPLLGSAIAPPGSGVSPRRLPRTVCPCHATTDGSKSHGKTNRSCLSYSSRDDVHYACSHTALCELD